MKYKAFISYSHGRDSKLAASIEVALEKYAKPFFKKRTFDVFRDENDLSASPNLWGKIESALKNSEYFIFLASEWSAKSGWCSKEINYWKNHKSMDNFLIVTSNGLIKWDEINNNFDWAHTNIIPKTLSNYFVNEPFYLALNDHELYGDLTLKNPVYREKLIVLAATLHNKSVGDMVGEVAERHIRNKRIRIGIITTLSILLVASIFLTIFAFHQKKIAYENSIKVLGSNYLANSEVNINLDPTKAVRWAEHAYKFAISNNLETKEFDDQLIKSFYHAENFYLENDSALLTNQPSQNVNTNLSPVSFLGMRLTNDKIASALLLKHPILGNYRFHYKKADNFQLKNFTFSSKGNYVISDYYENSNHSYLSKNIKKIHHVRSRRIATMTSSLHSTYLTKAVFTYNENRYLTASERQGIILYDTLQSWKIFNSMENITAITISNDGSRIAVAFDDGDIYNQWIDENKYIVHDSWYLKGHDLEPISSIQYSEDGNYLYSQSNFKFRKWNAENRLTFRYDQLEEIPSPIGSPIIETYDGNSVSTNLQQLKEDDGKIRFRGHIKYYIPKNDSLIAEFNIVPQKSNSSELYKWKSPNGRFYASQKGLFNENDQPLINFEKVKNIDSSSIKAIGFSTNSKFFFMIDKVYFLDSEMILSRLNNPALFDYVAPLNNE